MMNLSFFSDPVQEKREHKMQKAVASIKNRFGKNSVLRCMSLQEKATAQIRNKLVGGHNSGES
jgi:DNA polymerase V